MKFKSAVIASGGGSLGGLTLSRSRTGMYLRTRANPVNPNTAKQVLVRASFGNLSTGWQALTQVQRDAWTLYADNVPVVNSQGDTFNLTGHQMYVRCNTPRLQAGLATVSNGPVVFSHDSLAPVTAVWSVTTGTQEVAFDDTDDWVGEDDAALLVYGSQQMAPTINYFKGPYQLLGTIDGDSVTAPTSPDNSLSFAGVMTEANKAALRVRTSRADGRLSPVQLIGPQLIIA
jgi:hypothetical protein